jgi:hypothetical protein
MECRDHGDRDPGPGSAVILAHHREALARAVARIRKDPRVLAVILAGSLAHGYARRNSDVDLIIVVPDRDYRKRLRDGNITYWESESCRYKDGYVDGKYTSPAFLQAVARRGSDPARYAFRDAKVVFTRMRSIRGLLRRIARYPAKEGKTREARFLSQLAAWQWYYHEALKHRNAYLRTVAVSKIILFGCRLVLARNRVLYPYHKWMLRKLGEQKRKPRGILPLIHRILARSDPVTVERFIAMARKYAMTRKPDPRWARHFMMDSELNWLRGRPPVDDL